MDAKRTQELFSQLSNTRLLQFLQEQRETAVKFMTAAVDDVAVRRSQGKVAYIDELIRLLTEKK